MSKRMNIFAQGKPDNPYDERSDDGGDVPQRATAAQLATRKIKSAKARPRPAGASSVSSQSANFSTPLPNFNFGASAPAPSNDNTNNNAFNFSNSGAFGAGATNSFPPAQSSAPSNSFVNSSFPAFGTSNQNAGFNPQPSTAGFSFTAGNSNPFASSDSAPAINGATSTTPTFGAFGSQPSNNPFSGFGQPNTTSSASGNIFGTTSGTSTTGLFGTTNSSISNAASTPTSASQPFVFGGASSSTPNTASIPASSNPFGGLSAATQPATPAPNSIFSGFGTNTQKTEPTAPTNSIFSGFGTSAQATENALAPAPASNLFNFGSISNTKTTTAPSASLFGFTSSAAATPSTPALTSASNPFATLPTAPATSTPLFKPLDPTPQIPQVQEKAQTTSTSLFSNIKPAEEKSSAMSETPKPNLFTSLAKPNLNPIATPAATSGFSLFGATQNKDPASSNGEKPSGIATLKALEGSKSSLFSGFSTPQPAKTTDSATAQGGLFSAAQPKMSSGIFSQSFKPENPQSGGFTKTQSLFSSAFPATSAETKSAAAPQSNPVEASNPFSKLGTPSSEPPNLFNPVKEPAPASPSSMMPTLTGASAASIDTPKEPELPKIPKMHVPNEWAVPPGTHHAPGVYQQISDLTGQLQTLNLRYKERLNGLPLRADWSSLSLWHHKHASHLKKQIDGAKKHHAGAKGITGNESALSTKRKVNNESPEAQNISPSKRARVNGAPATPTSQSSAPPTKVNPPPTSTSNMFAKAIGNKPSTPSTSTSLFAPKTAEKSHVEPSKPAASGTGFTPFLPTSNGTSSSKFTPASTGFKPNFGGGATSGGGFLSQFSKNAKTYDELAAERKAKAKAEDYDSDDETEDEWSTRYDKKEAERLAAEKEEVASARGFSMAPSSRASDSSPPASNPFASLKPTSGASTSGLFSSRVGSPALSAGGHSVFDAPSTAQTPSSNIFGHLSSGPSSNNRDDSDEEEGQQGGKARKDQPISSVESTTPPKRKSGESETESDETLEETMRRKKQETGSRGSLLSRMTRGDGDDSEKENSNSNSFFGQVNGAHTPTNKPFQFFDFGAAGSGSTTPKPEPFAGDQTFKPGTPIKFGTETKTTTATPKFVFQPATPSAEDFSTTPAKPPPTSLFNFGSSTSGSSLFAPGAGFSVAPSVTSSVFSSRAGTPMSEAENSAASAAEEEDEGKQEQADFSQLTEEEKDANDVVFHADVVLAKHQVDKGDGVKAWTSLAKGPLWILKDKVTAACFIRIRIASGATPLDYRLLPKIQASVTGNSRKMVMATKPAKEGGLQQVLYAVKNSEIAEEFARKYNESLP